MKAIRTRLTDEKALEYTIGRIREQELNGKVMVTIHNAVPKTARQRGLQHLWYEDVVNSGIGGKYEEDTTSLDLFVKWQWVLKILLYDPGMDPEWQADFQDLFLDYSARYKHNPRKMKFFIKNFVHTEDLPVDLMAKVLTEFERYYLSKGAKLRDPSLYGYDRSLLEMREAA